MEAQKTPVEENSSNSCPPKTNLDDLTRLHYVAREFTRDPHVEENSGYAVRSLTRCLQPQTKNTAAAPPAVFRGELGHAAGTKRGGVVSDDLPNYIDIVGATSELDGETLTAVFHLREIPERMEFNRKGVPDGRVEYMWVVAISTEGDPNLTLVQFDYWLEASYAATRLSENTPGTMRDANAALQGDVLKYSPDSDKQALVMDPLKQSVDLAISHQDNTLTIVSHVPGIKPKSTIIFFSHDYLLGHDFVECVPE